MLAAILPGLLPYLTCIDATDVGIGKKGGLVAGICLSSKSSWYVSVFLLSHLSSTGIYTKFIYIPQRWRTLNEHACLRYQKLARHIPAGGQASFLTYVI